MKALARAFIETDMAEAVRHISTAFLKLKARAGCESLIS
jgi:hypothetical protein